MHLHLRASRASASANKCITKFSNFVMHLHVRASRANRRGLYKLAPCGWPTRGLNKALLCKICIHLHLLALAPCGPPTRGFSNWPLVMHVRAVSTLKNPLCLHVMHVRASASQTLKGLFVLILLVQTLKGLYRYFAPSVHPKQVKCIHPQGASANTRIICKW